jgi:hypothetical protein
VGVTASGRSAPLLPTTVSLPRCTHFGLGGSPIDMNMEIGIHAAPSPADGTYRGDGVALEPERARCHRDAVVSGHDAVDGLDIPEWMHLVADSEMTDRILAKAKRNGKQLRESCANADPRSATFINGMQEEQIARGSDGNPAPPGHGGPRLHAMPPSPHMLRRLNAPRSMSRPRWPPFSFGPGS